MQCVYGTVFVDWELGKNVVLVGEKEPVGKASLLLQYHFVKTSLAPGQRSSEIHLHL
jgi:hypothetical protein